MAGEMNESEVTRESYPMHFAVADMTGGSVRPFDQYQGPYVSRSKGRLWLCSEDGVVCYWYNESNDKRSDEFLLYYDDEADVNQATWAAEQVV